MIGAARGSRSRLCRAFTAAPHTKPIPRFGVASGGIVNPPIASKRPRTARRSETRARPRAPAWHALPTPRAKPSNRGIATRGLRMLGAHACERLPIPCCGQRGTEGRSLSAGSGSTECPYPSPTCDHLRLLRPRAPEAEIIEEPLRGAIAVDDGLGRERLVMARSSLRAVVAHAVSPSAIASAGRAIGTGQSEQGNRNRTIGTGQSEQGNRNTKVVERNSEL